MQSKVVVDEQFIPKVAMTFKILEEVEKFYKSYSKLIGFSTEIRKTTWKGDEIKNQLIICNRKGNGNKLSSQDLRTYIEGCRSLNNFQNCSESFAHLLSRPSRYAQTISIHV
ncbi:hypothetical protein AHAS_Ahas01G0139700 [Arachis hypogaea]